MRISNLNNKVICVVGLGYVGMPLAEAFSKSFKVVGFDVDAKKVKRLATEYSQLTNLTLTTDPGNIKKADVIIICVPTPVTPSKQPDLSSVISASEIVGRNMKKEATVVLESTTFPGTTEDIMKPILEKESGLKCGRDFKIGHSPERVNPGDKKHTIDRIIKVVAGMDEETTQFLAELYGKVAGDVFIARDIKTAEAAKVIENIQRDLNIALMNELAMIFEKMGLSIKDVLDAAATKWNFQRYSPGLVGGHCIPVDPYYLVYKALEFGYHPQVILAGRAINDYMPKHIAEMTIKALNNMGKVIKGSKVLIMGLTYKENVPDTRESPAKEMIHELKEFGVDVYGYDPLLDEIEKEFPLNVVKNLSGIKNLDAVVVAVYHDQFKKITLNELKKVMNTRPILIDVRQAYDRSRAERAGFYYQTL